MKLRNPTQAMHQQAVFLDVHEKNTASIYSVVKMHSLIHPNVLGCYYFKEVDGDFYKKFTKNKDFVDTKKDEKYFMVLTEQVSGSLEGFIKHKFQNLIVGPYYVPSLKCIELTRYVIHIFSLLILLF